MLRRTLLEVYKNLTRRKPIQLVALRSKQTDSPVFHDLFRPTHLTLLFYLLRRQ